MQTSRRRTYGAGLTSKNGLVTGRVRLIAGPIDIRWQRHGSTGVNIDLFVERHDALAVCGDFLDVQTHTIDRYDCANAHLAARVNHALPTRSPETFEKQKFDCSVTGKSPRCQNARK